MTKPDVQAGPDTGPGGAATAVQDVALRPPGQPLDELPTAEDEGRLRRTARWAKDRWWFLTLLVASGVLIVPPLAFAHHLRIAGQPRQPEVAAHIGSRQRRHRPHPQLPRLRSPPAAAAAAFTKLGEGRARRQGCGKGDQGDKAHRDLHRLWFAHP